MPLHPDFPQSPHAILNPDVRWYPGDQQLLKETEIGHLLPPLVQELRKRVKDWRDENYAGAAKTSRNLLHWWFDQHHPSGFQYFFAQREAVETVIYLYDVVKAKDKHDLMRFDATGEVSGGKFDESWRRYVIKMATGSGKTKVLSLVLAWSYFHKIYEPNSELARNFLIIAPNIIVLDRLRMDFDGFRIFSTDPVLPENGFEGHNWRDDFQLTVHVQDNVRVTQPVGNVFLTNIQRVYAENDSPPSPDDENTSEYFLGKRPTGATIDSTVDLGNIVRDIDELVVLNDEAHHIHDSNMAWFRSIEDIHNRLRQKGGGLALQVDTTATPKHDNGAIFVQTVSDYPLVEAIAQDVVKHPVVPDAESRNKLKEKTSIKFSERYADYLHLGVVEWRKVYSKHQKMGRKSILFVMTDDTKNCDEVAEYLQKKYSEFEDSVLVIHTKNNGEISEATSGKAQQELEKLRKQANEIDAFENPHKAVVSVMMLKEGWDVRNVTTIVGLRAYSSKSKILPEQTLGRGLRKMYPGRGDVAEETLSVVGTDAFMEFVETIQSEGVALEHREMGDRVTGSGPLVIEVDNENPNKNIDALDIEIPMLAPRIYRESKNLDDLDVSALGHSKVAYRQFSSDERRIIVFKDITTGENAHTTTLGADGDDADYRNVISYFARTIMKDLRLFSRCEYGVLYEKIKTFVRTELFGQEVELEDTNTLRNLAELAATKTVIETFTKAINELTVQDKGSTEIHDTIKLSRMRTFIAKNQGYVIPKKSVFNYVIGNSNLELQFASFLEHCPDVVSYAKNYLGLNYKLDYVNVNGDISNYYPDFFVKLDNGDVFIVETKGLESLDTPLKMARLKQWCEDINREKLGVKYDFIFVDEQSFNTYNPQSFSDIIASFRRYKEVEL